ncbi:MAG: tripartite tricarboxylate transporter substrate binding protein [Ideonella sp.]|nr:tripartite tricarboxylate transporter substrate binding protein [Ideonella sp.]
MNLTFRHARRPFLVLAALAVAFATPLLPTPAVAQAAGTLRIVVPFPAGGAADSFARLLGQKMAEGTPGLTVVIDNKPGAGGVIGSDAVAKAAPDGNTLLMVTVGHAVNPAIYTRLPYDTRADFVPVAVVASVPSLLVAGPSFPGKTLRELLDAAKARPGTLEYASSGTGSTSHVGAALIESMTGVDMLHVPYKGAGPALQDVMGGRIAVSVDIITSSLQLVKSGKLKALAITSARRSPLLPDVPTMAEAGVPGYEFTAWYMLLAPGRTAPAVVDRLNADIRRAEALPEFRARVAEVGGEPMSLGSKDSAAFLEREFVKWAKVVKDRHIKAD